MYIIFIRLSLSFTASRLSFSTGSRADYDYLFIPVFSYSVKQYIILRLNQPVFTLAYILPSIFLQSISLTQIQFAPSDFPRVYFQSKYLSSEYLSSRIYFPQHMFHVILQSAQCFLRKFPSKYFFLFQHIFAMIVFFPSDYFPFSAVNFRVCSFSYLCYSHFPLIFCPTEFFSLLSSFSCLILLLPTSIIFIATFSLCIC